MSKSSNAKPFGVKDQVSYMFGDVGGSFVNMYVDSYFLVFCTYVLGIKPSFMGTLFLIARIWDAINDPLIGSIPDRHLIGKSGDRFRPYIKIFMWPLAAVGLICFADVSSFPSVWKYAWVSVAYILYGMSYTAASMPYGSLATVMTDDPVENSKLSRIRSFGGAIAGICMAFVPQFIYDDNNNTIPMAFFVVAIVFGLLSILSYTILLAGSCERVHYEVKKEDYHYSEVLGNALRNRPLIGTMIAAVGFLFFNTGFNQTTSYLFKEYYHNTGLITLAAIISMPLMFLLFPFIPKLVKKFGKVKSVIIPTLFSLPFAIFVFLVPLSNPYVFIILLALAIIGPMSYALNCWGIVAECIEYHEYKYNQKANGSLYSIYTFSRKIGSAIASAFASYALAAVGYISGQETQTEAVANGIRYIASFIPLGSCILILVGLGLVFNLKKADVEKIHEELEAKHANEE